jgi:putative transposase
MNNHLDQHSMRALCQALEVSRSGFYAWRSRPKKSSLLDHKIEQMNQQYEGRLGGPAMANHITKGGFRASVSDLPPNAVPSLNLKIHGCKVKGFLWV